MLLWPTLDQWETSETRQDNVLCFELHNRSWILAVMSWMKTWPLSSLDWPSRVLPCMDGVGQQPHTPHQHTSATRPGSWGDKPTDQCLGFVIRTAGHGESLWSTQGILCIPDTVCSIFRFTLVNKAVLFCFCFVCFNCHDFTKGYCIWCQVAKGSFAIRYSQRT